MVEIGYVAWCNLVMLEGMKRWTVELYKRVRGVLPCAKE